MGDRPADSPPSRPDREGLSQLASEQRGYFTAAQGAQYGYSRALGGPAGGAVVSHDSALDLWGLTDSIPTTIHFTVTRTHRHPPCLPVQRG